MRRALSSVNFKELVGQRRCSVGSCTSMRHSEIALLEPLQGCIASDGRSKIGANRVVSHALAELNSLITSQPRYISLYTSRFLLNFAELFFETCFE